MAFFILTRFVLVKYSHAFIKRPSQGTSFLASRLTTVSLDIYIYILVASIILFLLRSISFVKVVVMAHSIEHFLP